MHIRRQVLKLLRGMRLTTVRREILFEVTPVNLLLDLLDSVHILLHDLVTTIGNRVLNFRGYHFVRKINTNRAT
jgi:hypothetical protein